MSTSPSSPSERTPVFQITAGVQSYEWGKLGSQSKAAQFGVASQADFVIDEGKPYAELWMGTHPSLPSSRTTDGAALSAVLASDPAFYLGPKVLDRFGPDLPFLFKVLAIGKALSIQAHPDKELAEKLHRERPEIYKDGNHKPEMAIALTPFRGFCGFRPLSEISSFLTSTPELLELVGQRSMTSLLALSSTPAATPAATASQRAALEQVFEALMTAPEDKVRAQLEILTKRYRVAGVEVEGDVETKQLRELVLELEGQYPGDIGVFCAFILNVVELKVGEAAFLKANEPHAYISGDIIECMATSDNVVRAGLTPKLRDVPTLLSMLTYTSLPSSDQLLSPVKKGANSQLYDPPIDEFSVLETSVPATEEDAQPALDGPSVLVVSRGGGRITWSNGKEMDLEEGTVWFIACGVEVVLKAGQDGVQVYRAYVQAD